MSKVRYIVFRYLTSADFFNIYKPSGTEEGGGGQAYIDFPTNAVSLNEWGKFFDGAASVSCDTGEQGPTWEFPINSLGLTDDQEIKVYQRRPQSICIASQRITSQRENRVKSWRPENGFPAPEDPTERSAVPENLIIYIVRTTDDEFWAGWTLNQNPGKTEAANNRLEKMLNKPSDQEGYAGFIELNGKLEINTSETKQPFNA
jgi:5-methylcytosine-specific restriction protein A